MDTDDDKVLRLARHYAKHIRASISPPKRKMIEFDELVSVGYLAGVPKKDEQSLWQWIRHAQMDFVKSFFSKKEPPLQQQKSVMSETEYVNEMLDLADALKNTELTATEIGVLLQRFWNGLTFVEIAEKLHVAPQTVREKYYKPAIIKVGLYLRAK